MSMTEIMLVQASFGLAMALFEFPSGYLADRVGYRRTLMYGSLLCIGGWAMYSVASELWMIVIAELILGVAFSLISGCDSALMYESLAATGHEADFAKWDGRARFWGQCAEGTGALVAGVIYAWWRPLPFVLEAIVWAVAFGVAWRLCEPPRATRHRARHWHHMRGMVSYMFRRSRRLTAIVAVTVIFGLASFVPVWLVPLYATGSGVAEHWIGVIWAVANYSVALSALWSHRIGAALGMIPTLVLCIFLVSGGYFGLGLSHGLFGFAFYYLLTTMRGLLGPMLLQQEHRSIPSADRAGFLSLRSLVFRVGFLVLGPAVGLAVDQHGQHDVLVVLGIGFVCSTTVAVVLFYLVRHEHVDVPDLGGEQT